jgi:hypothetical protein
MRDSVVSLLHATCNEYATPASASKSSIIYGIAFSILDRCTMKQNEIVGEMNGGEI